jgi:uncharacterized protein (DUF305 family)
MIRKIVFAAVIAVSAVVPMTPVSGFAQSATDHDMNAMSGENGGTSPAAQAYMRAMDKMHEAMGKITYTGNADVDFVRSMIPHHQAAIDMAKALIVHGKDSEIKKLAEDIVTAQEQEIDLMEAWLKANAPK